MIFSTMMNTWDKAHKAALLLAVSNVVLVLLLGVEMNHANSIKQEIILTPPRVDEKMVIGWDSANEAYVKSFGLYVATLLGNITQTNAPFIVDTMSQFVDSSIYPDVRKSILAAADSRLFKEAAGATKYEPDSIIYEPSTQKVFISGNSMLLTSVGGMAQRSVTYEMVVRIVERRPVVFKLDSYEGNQPHTEQWLKEHKADKPAEEIKQ